MTILDCHLEGCAMCATKLTEIHSLQHRQRTGCVVNGRPLAASKRAALQAVAADNSCRHQRIKEEERKTR